MIANIYSGVYAVDDSFLLLAAALVCLDCCLLNIFRIALSLWLFWAVGEKGFYPWPDTPIAASCNLLRILQLLPSLPPRHDTSRVPNHFLTITVPAEFPTITIPAEF